MQGQKPDLPGCLDHILRTLKNSMENEPSLKWNSQMRELIQAMIHFRKHLDPDDDRDPDKIDPVRVAEFEANSFFASASSRFPSIYSRISGR